MKFRYNISTILKNNNHKRHLQDYHWITTCASQTKLSHGVRKLVLAHKQYNYTFMKCYDAFEGQMCLCSWQGECRQAVSERGCHQHPAFSQFPERLPNFYLEWTAITCRLAHQIENLLGQWRSVSQTTYRDVGKRGNDSSFVPLLNFLSVKTKMDVAWTHNATNLDLYSWSMGRWRVSEGTLQLLFEGWKANSLATDKARTNQLCPIKNAIAKQIKFRTYQPASSSVSW